jgi:hypothetical protein
MRSELIPDGLLAALLQCAERGEQQDDERERECLNEGIVPCDPGGDIAAGHGGGEGVAEVDEDVSGAGMARARRPTPGRASSGLPWLRRP